MKKLFIYLICALMANTLMAQKALMIKCNDGITNAVNTSEIDSLAFDAEENLIVAAHNNLVTIAKGDIVAMNYTEAPIAFTVTFNGEEASVVNPYFTQGVSVELDGAHVTINNDNVENEFTFELCGETANGGLLYNGAFKTTIVLNGVTITNPNGPAIDIECGKRVALELKKDTESTLCDGADGDWKAALYCRGHLEVDKSGKLNITGKTKHALSTKEYLQLKKSAGTINILGAVADGIHCQQYFLANGFTVDIKNVGDDGIQAEASLDEEYSEDYPDGSLWIQGGTFTIKCDTQDVSGLKAGSDINISNAKSNPVINITTTGAGSKGIKADGNINISAGEITIKNSGTGLMVDGDSQTAKCISADYNVNLTGGVINLTATGAGGKGIKADGEFNMGDQASGDGPQLTITTQGGKYNAAAYAPGGGWPGGGGGRPGGEESGSSAKGIKAMGAIHIYGGESTITTTGSGAEGIESKTNITINGGKHYIKTYDDAINSAGAIKFMGGVTVCHSNGNDAVDSNAGSRGAIEIGDGILFTYSSRGGAEMGLDCDNNSYIQITGHGVVIAAGGNQGGSTSATISNAAQGYSFITSSISFQTGRYYTLADASGANMATFKFETAVSSSCTVLSATGMTKGSTYSLKYSTTEPTDATTAFHGLYLGSTATGTTNVTTFTAK